VKIKFYPFFFLSLSLPGGDVCANMRGKVQLVIGLLLCTMVCANPEAEGGTKPDAVSGGENKILVPGQQGYGVLNAAGYRKLNQIISKIN